MFKSVKSNKVSEHIIEQVRSAIFSGALKPGDRLPVERELMETFRVSKATLREALRSLEVLGFLDIRKGASGGAFVTEVNLKKARDGFKNFLLFRNLSLRDLSEVRLFLEPEIAQRAALSITKEDLSRLKELITEHEEMLEREGPGCLPDNEIEFHRIMAGMTGNPILMFIVDFVENLLVEAKEILRPSKEFSKRVGAAHRRIYQALSGGDGKKAREEMTKHIREVERDLLAPVKEKQFGRASLRSGGERTFPTFS